MVFKRHKITIFDLTVALSTQTCKVKYANWCPPGCDIHVICVKGQERLKNSI